MTKYCAIASCRSATGRCKNCADRGRCTTCVSRANACVCVRTCVHVGTLGKNCHTCGMRAENMQLGIYIYIYVFVCRSITQRNSLNKMKYQLVDSGARDYNYEVARHSVNSSLDLHQRQNLEIVLYCAKLHRDLETIVFRTLNSLQECGRSRRRGEFWE